jgi:hypothetical protein
MTLINDRLFDVDPFGGAETPREKRSALRSDVSERSAPPPVELLEGGWRLIREKGGVLPYAHLVKCSTDLNSVLTLCNQWGTTLPRFDDDRGRRCPICDMENQL